MSKDTPGEQQPQGSTIARIRESKEWLESIRAIFLSLEEDYGTIEAPSKDGFLEIAKLGSNAWNAWRKKHRDVTVDFSHTDFRSLSIDFSGFDFSREVNSEKKQSVTFASSIFGKNTDFYYCNFGEMADFSNVIFESTAVFYQSSFGSDANFRNAAFFNIAEFSLSYFGKFANFEGAEFHGPAVFDSAVFGDHTSFKCTAFRGWVDFSASTDASHSQEHSRFEGISFAGAKFHKKAKFSGRKFESTTDFGVATNNSPHGREEPLFFGGPTIFHEAPIFHGCKLHQDTNFEGAEFLAPPSQEAARAYRTLKLAMEQLKATREEQRFFRLEMKAEHPSLKRWRRLISSIYAMTSDYGFSLRRPLGALLCTAITIGIIHGGLANAEASKWQALLPSADFDLDRTLQWLRYIVINTLPVPGFDKTQMELRDALFGKDGAIVSIAMGLEMIHKVISLGCVFLLGLALRNLFKMKS